MKKLITLTLILFAFNFAIGQVKISDVKIGKEYLFTYNNLSEPDPFKEVIWYRVKVLDIKKGYVKYIFKTGVYSGITSSLPLNVFIIDLREIKKAPLNKE